MACQTTLQTENVSITSMMFQYIKKLLSERCICTRVGKIYSSYKIFDMGGPQGSIIAPILFTILIHDLPNALSINKHVAQYADDTATWVNTTLKAYKTEGGKSCTKTGSI